jgi:uncharacterized protein YgbK (DUF1537 family)
MSRHWRTRDSLFAGLRSEWPRDLFPQIKNQIRTSQRKIVVLDDDPTGTQTVHGIPVLTEWSTEALRSELLEDLPAFYLLTNSRSVPLPDAKAINREIGLNLREASRQTGREFVLVSRSDSTLRGHFPGEVEALCEALGQKFDAWLIVPFFLEGGRYTIHDIHYVADGEELIPAAESEFARDSAFGYRSSNLCEWIEEKTEGRVSAGEVASISIEDIRGGGPDRIFSLLMNLYGGRVCVVNAASYRDLEVFTLGLLAAEVQRKKFLYRTAASFVRVRAGIHPRPLLTQSDLNLTTSGSGLIIVGSYVPKTTDQVKHLLKEQVISQAEASVEALLDDQRRPDEIKRVAQIANQALQEGNDIVIYTSRQFISATDAKTSLSIGQTISQGLIAILRQISTQPRYIVAKGGITSSDIATRGLGVKKAFVCGQILPGVPIWQLGNESRYPGLIYIIFPGNVGASPALTEVVHKLKSKYTT